MKRIYVAAIGVVLIIGLLFAGYLGLHNRNRAGSPAAAGPVYAYADVEHIMMSHPEYSKYHHMELEYNAMIAQYQFEQWNYSQKASAQDQAFKTFGGSDALLSAALNQELQARVALKENELNSALQKRYNELLKTKKVTPSKDSSDRDLKIVNLKLKLRTLYLSDEERQATQQQLDSLLKAKNNSASGPVSSIVEQEVAAAMAPYKEQAHKELAAYAAQVKQELEGRQQNSYDIFKKNMDVLGNRPEPVVWNKDWKDKLDAKEKEMDDEKALILADIRDKAALVAQERGIDVIFSDYLGFGTAEDVTDDIIVKLA
jgi:hypothetical protein